MGPKMVITQVPGHPQVPELGQNHFTISPEVLPCPKGPILIKIKDFEKFWGGHTVAKSH